MIPEVNVRQRCAPAGAKGIWSWVEMVGRMVIFKSEKRMGAKGEAHV